ISNNLYVSSIVVNSAFSLLTIVMLYRLSKYLFNETVALLTVAIAVCLPWQVWLSLSGMAEPICHFFVVSGIYYCIRWIQEEERSSLHLAAISFLVVTMLRAEAWILPPAFCLLVLVESVRKRHTISTSKVEIACALAIPWIFVFLFFFESFMVTGKIIDKSNKMVESYLSLGGALAPLHLRLVRYPAYLFLVSPLISILSVFGIAQQLRNTDNRKSRYYLYFILFYFFGLVGNSTVTGADPTAAPLRVIVICALLLIPVVVASVLRLMETGHKKLGYSFFVFVIVWNTIFCFSYDRGYFQDICRVGDYLDGLWQEKFLEESDTICFEQTFTKSHEHDWVAVQVFSNRPDNCIIERFDASENSIFLLDNREFIGEARARKARIVIVNSPELIRKFNEELTFLRFIGDYALFSIDAIPPNVAAGAVKSGDIAERLNINFDNKLQLVGYTIPKVLFPYHVTLYWMPLNNMETDYTVFMEFERSSGGKRLERTVHFQKAIGKKSRWKPGQLIEDRHDFSLS
ncbi:MAG: glycosyltransferase family 39 protein, partial [candidate division WOR-3 bacterium]